MSPEISERSFEDAIKWSLLQRDRDAPAGEDAAVYENTETYAPGGYRRRDPSDYDRALCLLQRDVVDFVLARRAVSIADQRYLGQGNEARRAVAWTAGGVCCLRQEERQC